jgi:hypothetical protein
VIETEMVNLKGGKFCFGFRGFHPWSLGSLFFFFGSAQDIMAGAHGGETCSLYGDWEAKRDRKRLESQYQGHTQVT